MARNRPTVVFVMAIVNIVFGTLGLFSACCLSGGVLVIQFVRVPSPWNPRESLYKPMVDVLDAEVPNHLPIQMGIYGVELILAAMLIAGGIGLVGMHRWGRRLVVWASSICMIVLTGSFVWSLAVLSPVMHKAQAAMVEAMKTNVANQNAQMPNMGVFAANQTMEVAIPSVIYGAAMLYCVIALVTMLLPSVGRAFAETSHR